MKQLKNLFIAALAIFCFNACEDVPAPYTLPGGGSGSNGNNGATDENTVLGVLQTIDAYNSGSIGSSAQVKGYIVGYISDKSIDDAKFDGNATIKTNIILADTPDETNIENCIPVQLPSGEIRSKVNLQDHPDNYKRLVTLTGDVTMYFGVIGLKNTSKALFDGETDSEGDNEAIEGAYINEPLTENFGSFTTAQTEGNFPWVIDYSCAKASAYEYESKTNNAAQSWLLSPAIDFTEESEAYIKFDYVVCYTQSGKVKEHNQVLISSDYTDDVATATWTAIDWTATENSDYVFANSGKLAIPAEFMGKNNVRIAFKYTSTAEKAGTFEVKNVVVAKGAADKEEVTPDTPVTPTGENLLANNSFEDWDGTTPLNWTGTGHNATISQSTDAHSGSYAVLVQGDKNNKRLASQSYMLAAGTYTISAFVKKSGDTAGQYRIGYGIIVDGKIETSNYKYLCDPTATGDEWSEATAQFTLDEASEITILVMNSKAGDSAPILVDDVTLTTNDGGIAEGGEDNEEDTDDEGTESAKFTYTATTTVEPGKYIIVAGNNQLMSLEETQNYGYMQVTSVKPDNGTITTDDSNVFTLEAYGEGYTIKDTYGRYVYMTGSFNSFNVSTTITSADEVTWTITFDNNGNAIIKNKDSEKTLQYDNNYNSYGAYPDVRGTYPVLYKMN